MFCSMLIALSIGSLVVLQASKILHQEAHEKLLHLSSNYANDFSAIFKNIEGSVKTLESVVATSFQAEEFVVNQNYRIEFMKQMDDMLKDIGDRSTGIQGVYVIINPDLTGQVFESWFINDGKGQFIFQEPEDISTFYPTNKDMAWYYEPITKREGVWVPPYVDATINVKMISYTKAIFHDELLIGVVGIDLAFEDIEKTIGDMTVYESGYSFLLNEDYTILLHPFIGKGIFVANIENEDLDSVIESMKQKDSGVIEYVFRNEKKVMGFSRLSNDWILAVTTVTADILKPIDRLKRNITVTVVFLLLVTGIIGLFISKSITAPINKLKDMAALISQGQHDIELDLNSTSEIGELSKSIHVMTTKLVDSHKELQESEIKFRALADTSPLAIYMSAGVEQKAMYINPTFINLFGYTIDEVPTVDHWWPLAYPDPEYRKEVSDEWQEKVAHAIETESEIEPMEFLVTCKDGTKKNISWGFITIGKQNWAFGLDLTERKLAEQERERVIEKLQQSLEEIKSLRGILPICSQCKNIRNDEGYYEQIESYIQKHSEAVFTHGICPKCSDELYGGKEWYVGMKSKKGDK